MLISELIEKLQKLKETVGDIPVAGYAEEASGTWDITVVELNWNKTHVEILPHP